MAKKITLRDLEAACIEVLGRSVYQMMREHGGMTTVGDRAAMTCFLENKTGPHVEVIRECMKELRDTGVFPFYKKNESLAAQTTIAMAKPAPKIRVPKDKPQPDPFLEGIAKRARGR